MSKKRNRNILKVLLFLLVPVAVTAIVLSVDYSIIRKRMSESAGIEAADNARRVMVQVNDKLSQTRVAVSNFLAMTVYRNSYQKADGINDVFLTIDPNDLKKATSEIIYSSIEGFAVANPQIRSVAIIYDKGAIPGLTDNGFAPLVERKGLKHRDLSRERAINNSNLFLKGASTYEPFFSEPFQQPIDSVMLTTYVYPIYYHNDTTRLFEEFWVDIELDMMCDILEAEKPYPGSMSFIINGSGTVVASDDRSLVGTQIDPEVFYNRKDCLILEFPMEGALEMSMVFILPYNEVYANLDAIYSKMIWSILIMVILMAGSAFLIFKAYVDHERNISKTQHELSIAAGIQQGFLPGISLKLDLLDLFASTQPASTIGGDFYDYVEKDGKLYFCLGDVSGKSIPAALFMSMTDSLFRMAVRLKNTSTEIVSLMNESLVERNDEYMFCTMFVGIIDPHTGTIDFCNAGHNPVIALGKEKTLFVKVIPNRPLGLVSGYSYKSQTDELLPGQALFVYSDGVTEAKNIQNEQFGEERLKNTLTATVCDNFGVPNSKYIIDTISDAVSQFAGGASQSDDITMLCIRRKA